MRKIALASALLAGSLALVPAQAEAASRHPRSMTLTLSDGRVVKFRVVRIGGRMMIMAPLRDLPGVGG